MRKTYLYGAMALGLLFTACKSDDLQLPGNEVMEADQTFYVGMKISGDIAGTRASADNGNPDDTNTDENGQYTDFDPGVKESEVNNAYFVFYDMNGQVVGNIVPADLSDPNGWTNGTEGDGTTVEKYYRSVVPVSVRKGEMKPIQVICYINPISPATLQNPLNVIQTIARDQISTTVGDNTYFAMSNSVYYENATSTTPRIAVEIPNKILYDTEQKANDAIDALKEGKEGAENGVINVYVERYATKLSFNVEKAAEDYTAGTRIYDIENKTYNPGTVTLSFVPEYWTVNAQANNTYVIKSFRQESELGQIMADNYSASDLNQRINLEDPAKYTTGTYTDVLTGNSAWTWNNPTYHRSYWAISPAYFQSEYPEVSEDLKEMGGTVETNQTYIPYSKLGNNDKFGQVGKAETRYFRETTVGGKALASNNPAAATPSVILVGHYELKINDGLAIKFDGTNNTGFYTYLSGAVAGQTGDRPYIYFDHKANSLESAVTGGESMLLRFLAQSTVLYKADKDDEGKNTGTFSRYSVYQQDNLFNTLLNYLDVTEIDEAAKEAAADQTEGNVNYKALKLQANARSLQFTKAPGTGQNIYIATAKGYQLIVADQEGKDYFSTNPELQYPAGQVPLSVANATLMQQVGYAYYYLNGLGYFNIPVKHLGWYRGGNAQKNANKIDWKQVRVGDFGMVRNHSYNINVTGITGLASGIGGKDVPIVPPATTEDYYVAYSVRILKWAVVPTQNVEL